MIKKIVIGVGVVLVVLVVAVLAVPAFINWNNQKDRIAAAVREATGRELAIDGDLQVSVFPGVSFSAAGVRLANAPGFQPETMAKIARLDGKVALLPLIAGRVVVERLRVEQPDVVLQIDAQGRPNWVFETAGKPTDARSEEGGGFGGDLRIEDAKLEGGRVVFTDARTGQKIEGADIQAALSLHGLADPVTFDARANVNGDAVQARFTLNTPHKVMAGEEATVTMTLDAPKAKLAYDGGVQSRPVPGLDGTFTMSVPSVGALAAWLGRPLPKDQPDPGPLKAHAVFAADGARVALKEAVLEGRDLNAKASGSADLSGPAPKLALTVESGVLNIDRYLPSAPKQDIKAPRAPVRDDGLFAALSDEKLDVETLRKGEVDIKVMIAGVKALGYEVGPIEFVASVAGGKLVSELRRLQLYGGEVKGRVVLDGSGQSLALDTAATVTKVDIGKLASVGSRDKPPVTGVVSASIEAQGRGTSPKQLAESLKGQLKVDLGGMNVPDAAAGALSGLQLDVQLPGVERPPQLAASFVYKKEKMDVRAKTSPLPELVSGERFDVDIEVRSRVMNAGYKGAVVKAPVPGLDGTFDLDAPSTARLAAWLGRPLQGQPDPGPIKAKATFAADGGRAVLRTATIDSAALKAAANGSWSKQGDLTHVDLDIKGGVLDLDRLIGPSAPPTQAARPQGPLAALPADPIDLSALRQLDLDATIDLAGVNSGAQKIGHIALTARIDRGVATIKLDEVALHGGRIAGTVKADATGKALVVETNLKAEGLDVGSLTAANGPPPVTGNLSLDAALRSHGVSTRSLAEQMSGTVKGTLRGSQAQVGVPVSDLAFSLDVPGSGKTAAVRVNGSYNGEKVAANIDVRDSQAALAGRTFPANVELSGPGTTATFAGNVQQTPVQGLDGKLNVDIASVGKLAAWLGQKLDQPDPGPLKIAAVLSADGARTAVKQASIDGKAIRATGEASFDGTAAPRRFNAKLTVQEANLDVYLPAESRAGRAAGQPAAPVPSGWSNDPIDLAWLRDNAGEMDIGFSDVRYRGLALQSGRVNVAIRNGALTARLADTKVAEGTVAGKLSIADTGKGAQLSFDTEISGIAARPVLTALAGTDRLAGTASFQTKGAASGRSQREIVSTLDGNGAFKFTDGAIYGFNIASALRQVGSLGVGAGEEQKTDFAELSGTFQINDGVVLNKDLKLLAPLLRVAGDGSVNLPPQTVDYVLDATLVGSLQGQGGKDDLSGIPVPIKVTGPWAAPRYDVQWERILQAIASDPDRLKNLPGALGDLGKGIKLPGLDSLLGGGSKAGTPGQPAPNVAEDVLRGLFGGSKRNTQTAPAPQFTPGLPAVPQGGPADQRRPSLQQPTQPVPPATTSVPSPTPPSAPAAPRPALQQGAQQPTEAAPRQAQPIPPSPSAPSEQTAPAERRQPASQQGTQPPVQPAPADQRRTAPQPDAQPPVQQATQPAPAERQRTQPQQGQ